MPNGDPLVTKHVSLEMAATQHLYKVMAQIQIKNEATMCPQLTITMIS